MVREALNRSPSGAEGAERPAKRVSTGPLSAQMRLFRAFLLGGIMTKGVSVQFLTEGTPVTQSLDSFKCRKTLKVGNKSYVYYSLAAAEKNGLKNISKLP